MKKERHKIVAAVYAIIIKNGKILLSLRENTGFMDGWYSLVAGHVEADETVDEAMSREAKEEANIVVKSMKLGTVMFRKGIDGRDDYMDFFFIIDDYEGDIINKEPQKCGELKFFNIHSMPNNVLNYVSKAVDNALKGIPYDNFIFEEK